ncbi:unnamed protein product [Mytilus coruscus]|uniref:Uncharacterized protein n=1 Tax=Mytilus coruscus TaxID=42192 RepID=A0A6J8EFB6_MYTCO|nr:unnamed protein product [Mytilus coruscus]
MDRKKNLEKIKDQRQGFHHEIKHLRDKINTHLDKLEQQIISDLLSEERKIKTEIEIQLNKLSEKITIVQAQILFHTSIANKSFEDLLVTKIRQFKVPCKSGITGHTFSPNDDSVFVDFGQGNRLLIMDSTGSLRRKISLSSVQPFDVTTLDDRTVAGSTWRKKDMHVVDINSGTIKEHISGDFCGGLTCRGNTLVCCVRSNKIKAVDLRDNTVSFLISEVAIHRETYVTMSSSKLFVTHLTNNTVTCYNMNGDEE